MELDLARLVGSPGRVVLLGTTFCGVGRAGVIFTAGGVMAAFFSASLRRNSSTRVAAVAFFSGVAAVVSGRGPTILSALPAVTAGRVIFPGATF